MKIMRTLYIFGMCLLCVVASAAPSQEVEQVDAVCAGIAHNQEIQKRAHTAFLYSRVLTQVTEVQNILRTKTHPDKKPISGPPIRMNRLYGKVESSGADVISRFLEIDKSTYSDWEPFNVAILKIGETARTLRFTSDVAQIAKCEDHVEFDISAPSSPFHLSSIDEPWGAIQESLKLNRLPGELVDRDQLLSVLNEEHSVKTSGDLVVVQYATSYATRTVKFDSKQSYLPIEVQETSKNGLTASETRISYYKIPFDASDAAYFPETVVSSNYYTGDSPNSAGLEKPETQENDTPRHRLLIRREFKVKSAKMDASAAKLSSSEIPRFTADEIKLLDIK
jgi:hypothetical protein